MRFGKICILVLAAVMLLAGCRAQQTPAAEPTPQPTVEPTLAPTPVPTSAPSISVYVDEVTLEIENIADEAVILEEAPQAALPDVLVAEAPGVLVAENEKACIDYSNTGDGYVMMLFSADTNKRIKAQIKGPTTTYTYNLYKDEWAVLPLTDGEGSYQFKVFQNVSGDQYSLVLAEKCDVTLEDEFAPFIRPNQFVNYSASSKAVEKAYELTHHLEDPIEKVEVIYDYVVSTLSYDKEKAATVKSGYLCDMDQILEAEKGICFDYAALMTGMLRSQGIPCKMVFGYAGTAYHAWISVWTEDTGWVDGVIFFDGTTWKRLDPTFASSSDRSDFIMDYIGDGSNYKEKYLY